MSSDEIRDKAVTFFKHSDLRSSQHNANASTVSFPHQASFSQQRPSAKSEADKSCRQWNYYGSCACDKSNPEAFNARHKCRVCTKDHPMLQCPKRRNPIPPLNAAWLHDLNLHAVHNVSDTNSFAVHSSPASSEDSLASVSLIVKHILASKHDSPNAFGAQVPIDTSPNISAWASRLHDYFDSDIVKFLR